MRYVVEYTYGPGSYGKREFDWSYLDHKNLEQKAKSVAPLGTRIIGIKKAEKVNA